MTEKRFELKLNINSIGLPEGKILTDNLTGEKGFSLEEFLSIANKLNNENKELKDELRIYRSIANCRNCGHHDYDWFDDGDEFEVCRKGNDVTEGICEEWDEL